jgi:hypothetical protein
LDEWLPADHFARFVIAAVEAMDLTGFYAAYRADGHGRPAHHPSMMVALLVYAYARGKRSSRAIERGCIEDIAFRVIAANRVPDHTFVMQQPPGMPDDVIRSPDRRAGARTDGAQGAHRDELPALMRHLAPELGKHATAGDPAALDELVRAVSDDI